MGEERKSSKKKSRQSRSRSRSRSKDRKDERRRRSRSPRNRSRERRRRSKSRSRSREDKRARKEDDKAAKHTAVPDPKKKEQEELEEQMRLRREKMAKWRAEKALAEGKGEVQGSDQNAESTAEPAPIPEKNAGKEEVSEQQPARVKKEVTEDDYFAEQEQETMEAETQAQDSAKASAEEKKSDEEEEDPLESFMKGVTTEVKKLEEVDRKRMSNTVDFDSLKQMVGGRRVGDSAIGIRSKAEGLGMRMEVEDSIPVVDEDGGEKEKEFDIKEWLDAKNQCKNLRPVDHSKMTYAPFRKNFNVIPAEIACMTGWC